MKIEVLAVVVCMIAAVSFASADTIHGIEMEFVNVGNAGNAADTTGYGAVGYNYRVGKYEVTNAQWNTFVSLAGAPTGNDGGYASGSYFTGAQQPTNNVSWYEAAQFCNYLTSGDKYSGAYQFDISGNFLGIDRVASISTYGTTYVIPTEDEWYKAAYFKNDASGYSPFANGTDTAPIEDVESNYNNSSGAPWDITNGTQEQNGTFNMMGNVWEWNETLINSSYRGCRGGSYESAGDDYVAFLKSSYRGSINPNCEDYSLGFRVASVPEPCSLVLLSLCGLVSRRRVS
jgi:formylglycine-generating enzyme required for sulfatase activity